MSESWSRGDFFPLENVGSTRLRRFGLYCINPTGLASAPTRYHWVIWAPSMNESWANRSTGSCFLSLCLGVDRPGTPSNTGTTRPSAGKSSTSTIWLKLKL